MSQCRTFGAMLAWLLACSALADDLPRHNCKIPAGVEGHHISIEIPKGWQCSSWAPKMILHSVHRLNTPSAGSFAIHLNIFPKTEKTFNVPTLIEGTISSMSEPWGRKSAEVEVLSVRMLSSGQPLTTVRYIDTSPWGHMTAGAPPVAYIEEERFFLILGLGEPFRDGKQFETERANLMKLLNSIADSYQLLANSDALK